MSLYAVLDDRDFTQSLITNVELTPESYSFAADGGPDEATIVATSDELSLWGLVHNLRCPVWIKHPETGVVWWGYLHEIEIAAGDVTVGVSLDSMHNRIQIAYNEPVVFGTSTRKLTSWSQDNDSVATYGSKELKLSIGDITDDQATRRLLTELQRRSRPQPTPPSFGQTEIQARLICRGWRSTLAWKYYQQLAGLEQHASTSNEVHVIGLGFTGTEIGFSAAKQTIHDLAGRMSAFKKDDRIQVIGPLGNSGIYTIAQGTTREAAILTAPTIAFDIQTKRTKITDAAEGLAPALGAEGSTGWQLIIENSTAGNNGSYLVTAFSKREIEIDASLNPEGPGVSLTLKRVVVHPTYNTYIASTITIGSGYTYRITDSAQGLNPFDAGDMILISGSAGNDGWARVESGAADGSWITIDRIVTAAVAGPNVTIQRGNSIVVNESVVNAFPGTNITIQTVGQRLAQSFQTTVGGWTLGAVSLRLRKQGIPADTLRISLYSDSAGQPGIQLDTITIIPSDLPDSIQWIPVELSNTVQLAGGTIYHLLIERTGSLSETDYYEVGLDNELGYLNGSLQIYVDSTWGHARTPDADLSFKAIGYKEITEQIRDLIATAGQFFTGVDVIDQAGIAQPQYRDGEQTAEAELENLLATGTSDGRRLLATVTTDRVLRIAAEPLATDTNTHIMGKTGRVRGPLGQELSEHMPIVGVWATLNIVPTAAAGVLAQAGLQFLERVTIDAASGRTQYAWRNQEDQFDLGGIRDG